MEPGYDAREDRVSMDSVSDGGRSSSDPACKSGGVSSQMSSPLGVMAQCGDPLWPKGRLPLFTSTHSCKRFWNLLYMRLAYLRFWIVMIRLQNPQSLKNPHRKKLVHSGWLIDTIFVAQLQSLSLRQDCLASSITPPPECARLFLVLKYTKIYWCKRRPSCRCSLKT